MKKKSNSPAKKPSSKPKRQSRAKFPLIAEEMKQWSAMLQSELDSWPAITKKSMFGFTFFYRRRAVFAALPRTRGFDSPSSIVFKFSPLPSALRNRAQADSRLGASTKATSKGWFSFQLTSTTDLRDALYWLNHAYEAAHK
ncbi:MAG: hypothetical protein WBL50_05980 [Candidatus Acidiferrum sp.]